ncbi:MAG: IS1634 family transposase [Polyangiaceae bacterium]|nr:IS1634 family transposase [Polyangiaceae bacterium]
MTKEGTAAAQVVAVDGGPPVQVRDAWPYGGVYVLEQLWREVGIDRVVREHARSPKTRDAFERALFAMVANRALSPYSKLYCWEQWLREEVFLPSAASLDLHHLYFAMDFLEDHKTEIEKAVYLQVADLLSADVDLIFCDTTSLNFEVDEEDEAEQHHHGRSYDASRKRGHSKNGRTDAPQIVIGLAVTRDGLPVRSWVFPGNTADVTTVAKVKEDLRGWRLGRCVFVGDAGMNSLDNRRSLSLGGGKYILAARMRGEDEVTNEVMSRAGRYQEVRASIRSPCILPNERTAAVRVRGAHGLGRGDGRIARDERGGVWDLGAAGTRVGLHGGVQPGV